MKKSLSARQKKAILIIVILAVIIQFFPFRMGTIKDGGTKTYGAVAYKVVKWNRIMSDGETVYRHRNTCVYWFPDSLKSYDELWEIKH